MDAGLVHSKMSLISVEEYRIGHTVSLLIPWPSQSLQKDLGVMRAFLEAKLDKIPGVHHSSDGSMQV